MGRVPADATAFPDRSSPFWLNIYGFWNDATRTTTTCIHPRLPPRDAAILQRRAVREFLQRRRESSPWIRRAGCVRSGKACPAHGAQTPLRSAQPVALEPQHHPAPRRRLKLIWFQGGRDWTCIASPASCASRHAQTRLGRVIPERSSHRELMGLALAEARAALATGDVPIGALILGPDGNVLATGRNEREAHGDPTAHAEVIAIRAAADALRASGKRRWLASRGLHAGGHP